MKYKYENRVVAFIDILGFKAILNTTVDDKGNDIPSNIDLVVDAYNSIRDVWDLNEERFEDSPELKKAHEIIKAKSKRITTFSDSIVISFLESDESEIFFTLLELKWVVMRLISKGILCRGALTYGKMIHTDKFLFGPALVEAYELESTAALYPRIILSEDLIRMAGQFKAAHHDPETEISYVKQLLKKDTDGMYYIDYFLGAQSELDDPENDFPEYVDRVSTVVKKGITAKNPNVRIKYMWAKEKINKVIKLGKRKGWIDRLRASGNDELADSYESLEIVR